MRYLPLIWAGLWRKPVRTLLTLLSIVVAFLLLGLMYGVTGALDTIVDRMSETRLRIQSRVNITQALPLAHLPQIETVPGVRGVGYYGWFGGYYQDPTNSISVGAMDMERVRTVFPDVVVAPEAYDAMLRTRNGALVGEALAAEEGWKVGDIVPLRSQIWQRKDGAEEWVFEIVGSYRFAEGGIPTEEFWINYDYFDEARTFGNGTVSLYFVQIDDPAHSARVAEAIDERFANSSFETQTQNEKDWIRAQINQIGDINFFVNAIVLAAMFTLLFLTGNTMMQSVRERVPELAVLKTYGFGNTAVGGLVFAEAAVLCLVAAGAGLALAAAAAPSVYDAMGSDGLAFPTGVIGIGLGLAVLVALVSAILPALHAQRLSIVDALAGR